MAFHVTITDITGKPVHTYVPGDHEASFTNFQDATEHAAKVVSDLGQYRYADDLRNSYPPMPGVDRTTILNGIRVVMSQDGKVPATTNPRFTITFTSEEWAEVLTCLNDRVDALAEASTSAPTVLLNLIERMSLLQGKD